jgi:hypothetical protein
MANESLIAFVAARPADEADADALAAWSADVTTARPIPLGPLSAYLRTTGLSDVLSAAAADPAAAPDVKSGLKRFMAHVADLRQQTLDTSDPVVAGQTAAVLAALLAAKAATPEQAAAILALGGGPRHPAATLDDVAAARQAATVRHAEAERAAAFAELDDRWGVDVYQAGRAEILRRRDAGEPVPTVDDVLAFVAAQRAGGGV